jgi:hypothetical protein
VNSILRRRGVVFLLSDFLVSGLKPALEPLARRHDVVALQLSDPRERELPDLGLVTLADPESGSWRLIDTGNPEVRQALRSRAEDFERRLLQEVAESGGDMVRLETGRSYAEPLIAFFRRRERSPRSV